LMLIIWSGYTVSFPADLLPGKTIVVGDIVISPELLWALVIVIVAFAILAYFFMKTNTGLKMRAVSEDHELSMSVGINITFIFAIAWIIAVMLGTLSGILLGNRIGLAPTITPLVALRAFPAVIFGGLESIVGAVIGGLTIGIIENVVGGMIDRTFGEATAYIILLLVLIIRPQGLFGLKRIERV